MIDLRSDTITKPTPAMRDAMARAEVGDDVFREDPTVRALEARVADMLGHEAALFVASGTMGNVIAIRVLTSPGDEVIAEHGSHLYNNEVGGAAAISGIQIHAVRAPDGVLTPSVIASAIRTPDDHHSETRVVAVENTHNFAGGVVHPLDTLREIAALARDHGLRMHLDGARLWNASAESGVALSDYGRLFDTVTVCLSKGLGCPVGSVLASSRERIDRARRVRKMLGGGMRQAGVLAAAGLHALDHHLPRLREDHDNARRFAELACAVPGVRLAQPGVQTNIVFLETDRPAQEMQEALAEQGVAVFAIDASRFRAVFHQEISREDAERAAEALAAALGAKVAR